MKTALLIGNSDGIGLEVTKRLILEQTHCIGISRSASNLSSPLYSHHIFDVTEDGFVEKIKNIVGEVEHLDLVIFFVGIGDLLNWEDLSKERKTFEVNTMSAVKTTEVALEKFIKQKRGTFIGLSSVADVLTSKASPSYSASKSAVSMFWEGLSLANKNSNIHICNVRFGFVDTKMAKAKSKPFLLSKEKAADVILKVVDKPTTRTTKPRRLIPILCLLNAVTTLKIWFK